jgi:hypothetical protein
MLSDGTVYFKIKINTGLMKGEVLELFTTIEGLQEKTISSTLIEMGYLLNYAGPGDYEVIERTIGFLRRKK